MLHIKFQASEPSSSEEEDFEYLTMYYYGSNLGSPGIADILETGALIWTNLEKKTLGIAICQISSI